MSGLQPTLTGRCTPCYPQVLHGGTERGYSALAWNASGDTLASVGSFPDFLLTLWDWRQAAIVLRAKAFSQDVYTVAFSPYFEGQLTTSGASRTARFTSAPLPLCTCGCPIATLATQVYSLYAPYASTWIQHAPGGMSPCSATPAAR